MRGAEPSDYETSDLYCNEESGSGCLDEHALRKLGKTITYLLPRPVLLLYSKCLGPRREPFMEVCCDVCLHDYWVRRVEIEMTETSDDELEVESSLQVRLDAAGHDELDGGSKRIIISADEVDKFFCECTVAFVHCNEDDEKWWCCLWETLKRLGRMSFSYRSEGVEWMSSGLALTAFTM